MMKSNSKKYFIHQNKFKMIPNYFKDINLLLIQNQIKIVLTYYS